MGAVKVHDRILERCPDNAAAFNLKLRCLMDLGAASLVLEKAGERPDLTDPTVLERARTDTVMHQIRWGEPQRAIETSTASKKNMPPS